MDEPISLREFWGKEPEEIDMRILARDFENALARAAHEMMITSRVPFEFFEPFSDQHGARMRIEARLPVVLHQTHITGTITV